VLTSGGIGAVWGTTGFDASGWIGMGEVFGAFCTGVAFATEASGAEASGA
jgi:hypothetical protein